MRLNKKKLIAQAEALLQDPQIGFAAGLGRIVQEVEHKGMVYEMTVELNYKRKVKKNN